MAFGFGFNKQKTLSSAEKYVQQGKISNAISEYQKVIKADAKDLTVINTVGDLYSRLGEVDKATECFKTVGDAYASQGFTVKAIAMYKKISKLKPSLESVLKLAELYTQQGLFNDARSQYLQVAEEFLKANELDNAVRIFQKILEMDPDNTTMRVRLAEVYVRLGKKTEAWQIFSAAAEALRAKGSLTSSDEVLQRMLTIDPGNSYALLMQGRNQLQGGDAAAAIESFKKISDLDSNREGLNDLFKAYIKTERLSDAGTLARKLLAVHNDLAPITTFADALMQAGQFENALQVYDEHADRMMAEDSGKVVKNLHSIIGHVRDNPSSLEKLLGLFHKAGETTHVNEVTELLAHASVQAGDLPKARDLYQKLAVAEPGNPLHLNAYQQVVNQLGGPTPDKLISAEEAAVIVDELEAISPPVPQHYSDAITLAVRAALTDAELFISYNMPAKALGPLTAALPKAPTDLRLNQRLAALHTRAGRFAEAGVCCRNLQNVFSQAGYPEEATRYGELADRYEMRSHPAPAEIEVPTAFAATAAAGKASAKSASAPWPSPAQPAEDEAEFAIVADQTENIHPAEISAPAAENHELASPEAIADTSSDEIDLSSEWDDALTIDADDAPPAAVAGAEPVPAAITGEASGGIAEIVEELRFYLDHGMPEQAAAVFARLETLISDEAVLDSLRTDLQAALRSTPEQHEEMAPAEAFAVAPVVEAEAPEFAIDLTPAEAGDLSFELPTVADETTGPVTDIEASSAPDFEIASLEFAEDEPGFATSFPVDATVSEAAPSLQAAEPAILPEPENLVQEFAAEEVSPVHIAPLESVAEIPAHLTAAAEEPAALDAAATEAAINGVSSEPVPAAAALQEFASDLEASLEGNFAPAALGEIEHDGAEGIETPAHPDLEPIGQSAPTVFGSKSEMLGDFVADIEASLGEDFLKAAPVATSAVADEPVGKNVETKAAAAAAASQGPSAISKVPAPAAISAPVASSITAPAPQQSAAVAPAVVPMQVAAPVVFAPPTVPSLRTAPSAPVKSASPFGDDAGVDLAEMFGELKEDLESGSGSNDEDPETHYNLGIAFREMGLLDEAIGELQKTCQAVDRGHPFPQVMQTYTWLAQCFLDKGVPEAAIRWYDKALNAKGIDEETRIALYYELAIAYEACGDKASALKNFMEVYGRNIDYRDVAERIKQLR